MCKGNKWLLLVGSASFSRPRNLTSLPTLLVRPMVRRTRLAGSLIHLLPGTGKRWLSVLSGKLDYSWFIDCSRCAFGRHLIESSVGWGWPKMPANVISHIRRDWAIVLHCCCTLCLLSSRSLNLELVACSRFKQKKTESLFLEAIQVKSSKKRSTSGSMVSNTSQKLQQEQSGALVLFLIETQGKQWTWIVAPLASQSIRSFVCLFVYLRNLSRANPSPVILVHQFANQRKVRRASKVSHFIRILFAFSSSLELAKVLVASLKKKS